MKGKEKMENKGTILSYRPDIRVVDATIRDGGLVNDFRFTDEFVKNPGRVFDTLFAPWFSHSPTLQPFEAYFFVKF